MRFKKCLDCCIKNAVLLYTALITSGVAGWHMTASIGGADMPVVITII